MKLIRLQLNRDNTADPNVLAFIEDNGLSPNDVLSGEVAVIHDGTLTVHVIRRHEDGRKVLSHDGDRILTEQVTVPLISAPENFGL